MTTMEISPGSNLFKPSKTYVKLIGLIILVLTFFVLRTLKRKRRSSKFQYSFHGPTPLPLIGNALLFFNCDTEHIMKTFIRLQEQYRPPYSLYLGTKRCVIVGKPEDLQIILNSPNMLDKDTFYEYFNDAVGTGIFTAPATKWRKTRKTIAPAFNPKILEEFLTIFNEANYDLMQKLKPYCGDGIERNIWQDISILSLDMICQNAMGYKINTDDEQSLRFGHALHRISELAYLRAVNPLLHYDFIFKLSSCGREMKEICKVVRDLPREVIQKKKIEYAERKRFGGEEEETGKRSRTFIDVLLESNDQGITDFSEDELIDETTTMMAGGSETSAVTNCFALLALAMYPEVQDKVFEEQMNIFHGENRPVTMDDLRQMVYTEQVIKETMRLFTPVPQTLRAVNKDTQISGNRVLTAGTAVVVSPLAAHLNPDVWPEPKKFNPDNFSAENVEKRHRYAFIPFSGGPRGCIGSRYALMSMKTTMSMFVRHYKLVTTTKLEDIRMCVDLLARSKNGWNISLEPRICD